MPHDQVEPAFLGTNDLKTNSSVYPKYNIEKISYDEFELKFYISSFKKIDINVEIVPINCDHEILWLIEVVGDGLKHFSGLISHVESNIGMWMVEAKKCDNTKFSGLVLDLSNKTVKNTGIIKNAFSLSLLSTEIDKDNFIKILVKKM